MKLGKTINWIVQRKRGYSVVVDFKLQYPWEASRLMHWFDVQDFISEIVVWDVNQQAFQRVMILMKNLLWEMEETGITAWCKSERIPLYSSVDRMREDMNKRLWSIEAEEWTMLLFRVSYHSKVYVVWLSVELTWTHSLEVYMKIITEWDRHPISAVEALLVYALNDYWVFVYKNPKV